MVIIVLCYHWFNQYHVILTTRSLLVSLFFQFFTFYITYCSQFFRHLQIVKHLYILLNFLVFLRFHINSFVSVTLIFLHARIWFNNEFSSILSRFWFLFQLTDYTSTFFLSFMYLFRARSFVYQLISRIFFSGYTVQYSYD